MNPSAMYPSILNTNHHNCFHKRMYQHLKAAKLKNCTHQTGCAWGLSFHTFQFAGFLDRLALICASSCEIVILIFLVDKCYQQFKPSHWHCSRRRHLTGYCSWIACYHISHNKKQFDMIEYFI